MNSQLEAYIEKNKVTNANFLMFRDWEKFLNILFSNNGYVEMIVWYEYCRINEQQIGMGGYKDPVNHGYMWAETFIFGENLQQKSLPEIMEYISKTRDEYENYDLYPEFYIC